MKNILLLIIFGAFGMATAQAQEVPIIKFKDTMQYHMGTFRPGEVAQHTFEFTNIGTGRFHIKEVKTTCSCTATDWPRGGVAAGETGKITVTFDTKGKDGEYAKGVNIFSNAGELNLIIMVNVTGDPVETPAKTDPMPKVDPHAGHNH
ncbi:MAG: hypothetical protein ACI8SE_001569 [Bacteroidia bacterium]|jgi:hypothetical protein